MTSNSTNVTVITSIPISVNIIRYVCIPVYIILILFGIFGNVLTIIVLRYRHLKTTSTAVYLTALAVADLLYLCCSTSVNLIDATMFFPRQSLRHVSSIACHILPILQYSISYISVWLLVAVTFDRMFLVLFPMSAKQFSNKSIASIISGCIIIFFFLSNMHFFWTLRYDNRCKPTKFTELIYPYFDLIIIEILPGLLMAIFNTAIIIKIHKMKRFRDNKNNNQPASTKFNLNEHSQSNKELMPTTSNCNNRKKSRDKRTANLTKMLLCTNIFFMVSVAPLLIYNIVFFTNIINELMRKNEKFWGGVFYGIERVVYILWYTNFSIHFLLYCLSGPNFRDAALKTLGIKKQNGSCYNNNPTTCKTMT